MKGLFFKALFCAFFISYGFQAFAMDQQKTNKFYSIIMPGQSGAGGRTFESNNVVNTSSENTVFYETLCGPAIDLGQGNCIKHFEDQYEQNANAHNKNRLFYGISQGTATLTNWLAQKTHAQQNETAKLLVLEGVLGSGNSAIMHTVGSGVPFATYLPFARVWVPLLAKIKAFPTYNPFGKKAVESAKKLSPSLPIVIMHNKGDLQLSINDAREYYCAVKEQGNNNVYLMEVDNGRAHFDVLNEGTYPERACKIRDLQAIYTKHDLPANKSKLLPTTTNEYITKTYQPTVQEVRQRIRETNRYSNVARNIIDIACISLMAAGIGWKCLSKEKRVNFVSTVKKFLDLKSLKKLFLKEAKI